MTAPNPYRARIPKAAQAVDAFGLTPLEQLFCENFMRLRDPYLACRDAREQLFGREHVGADTAIRKQMYELQANPLVKKRIDDMSALLSEGLQIDHNWVVSYIMSLLHIDPTELMEYRKIKVELEDGKSELVTTHEVVLSKDMPPQLRRMLQSVKITGDGIARSGELMNKGQLLNLLLEVTGLKRGDEASNKQADAVDDLVKFIQTQQSGQDLLPNDDD